MIANPATSYPTILWMIYAMSYQKLKLVKHMEVFSLIEWAKQYQLLLREHSCINSTKSLKTQIWEKAYTFIWKNTGWMLLEQTKKAQRPWRFNPWSETSCLLSAHRQYVTSVLLHLKWSAQNVLAKLYDDWLLYQIIKWLYARRITRTTL